nr:hypothetical protein Q903MT_gene4995 [Picea sitchensis]
MSCALQLQGEVEGFAVGSPCSSRGSRLGPSLDSTYDHVSMSCQTPYWS